MNIKEFNDTCGSSGMRTDMLCSFCQKNKAVSMWPMPKSEALFCCQDCAVNKLPVFIADSVPLTRSAVNVCVEKILAPFWKAVSIRRIK